ncbi:MAG: thioredoxin domain-containing protein [bacterium]|nr:thioredoxin domain-containing protein [bacterium]
MKKIKLVLALLAIGAASSCTKDTGTGTATYTVITVTEATFDKEVLQSKTPVIVDFSAEWCGPCRAFRPVYESYASKFGKRAKFVTIDIEEFGTPFTEKYNIGSIPQVVVFENGKESMRNDWSEHENPVIFLEELLKSRFGREQRIKK